MTSNPELPQTTPREKKSRTAVTVGLLANLVLAALKVSVGILGHSPALLADGINSTSDVAYYVVVSIFIRVASKPADDEHPYGHSQLESIGALVVGSFVITTAVAIFWNSLDTLFNLFTGVGDFSGGTGTALLVAVFTVLAKIVLTLYTRKVGNTTQNASIIALAYDHRNDIISAMAVVIGLMLGRMGYLWVEPLAGAFVALVILQTGIGILRESTADLMDTVPGKALRTQVLNLLAPVDGIKEIEDIHAHRFGPYMVINITIGVDGAISVREGDQIASLVEDTLYASIDLLRNVHVHYHPSHHTE
jgi:cation diffusion facilitator family transporter